MTEEFDALVACGVVISSPFANKVSFFFVLKIMCTGKNIHPNHGIV